MAPQRRTLSRGGTVSDPPLAEVSTSAHSMSSLSSRKALTRSGARRQRETERGGIMTKRGHVRGHYKNGEVHVLKDLANTVLALPTAGVMLLFVGSAIGSYLLFGLLWWSIDAWDPECVSLLNTFNEALLFSIETQTTIGYGSKHVQGDCSVGIALLMTQSITGLLIDVIVFGLLYSKVTKPARRVIMLRVSHDALIGERDGERQLMIRVGDMRKRGGLTAVEAKLFMVFEHTTTEGEYIPFHAAKLEVDEDSVSNEPMLAIPWTVAHKIDEDSPLFGKTRQDLEAIKAEIVFVMHAEVQDLAASLEFRTSYLPQEIFFNHRFVQTSRRETDGSCSVDWTVFDTHVPFFPDTPPSSIGQGSESSNPDGFMLPPLDGMRMPLSGSRHGSSQDVSLASSTHSLVPVLAITPPSVELGSVEHVDDISPTSRDVPQEDAAVDEAQAGSPVQRGVAEPASQPAPQGDPEAASRPASRPRTLHRCEGSVTSDSEQLGPSPASSRRSSSMMSQLRPLISQESTDSRLLGGIRPLFSQESMDGYAAVAGFSDGSRLHTPQASFEETEVGPPTAASAASNPGSRRGTLHTLHSDGRPNGTHDGDRPSPAAGVSSAGGDRGAGNAKESVELQELHRPRTRTESSSSVFSYVDSV